MVLTIAMTAAPAPASAHTNRWKVKSSCNTQESFVLSFDYTDVCLDICHESLCLHFTSNIKKYNKHQPCSKFHLTSLESHMLKNFADPVHTFLSSEMVTAPD